MATRTVHIAEVNPEKSAPLSSDAWGIKKLQPLIFKGCAVVVTVGLEPVVRILNRRDSPLGRSLVSDEKAADEISATGSPRRLSPVDVNDVLSLCSRFAAKCHKI